MAPTRPNSFSTELDKIYEAAYFPRKVERGTFANIMPEMGIRFHRQTSRR